MARPSASDAELRAAVDHAALGELVDALPDGLATPVGERGASLSGGQRQRAAIARAFLKDAPMLILAAAPSHLDAVNEQLVRAIGRAHVCTPVTNAQLVCRLPLEKTNTCHHRST